MTLTRRKSASEWQAEAADLSEQLGQQLLTYLWPLLDHLHREKKVDKRPLRTLVQTVEAILAFRNEVHGLVLSELGGYLDRPLGGGAESNAWKR
jgi:hypothetical protein